MWSCSNCYESVDDSLELCWNCGTNRSGLVDPTFQHADHIDTDAVDGSQDAPDARKFSMRFSMWSLVISVTCVCVILSVLRTKARTIVICCIVGGYIYLHVLSFFIASNFRHRDDKLRK